MSPTNSSIMHKMKALMAKKPDGHTSLTNAPYLAALGVFMTALGVVEAMQRSLGFWPPLLLVLLGAGLIGLTVKLFKDALLSVRGDAEK